MQQPSTGLALGGGAALGAAHIGVLKAIDEYNIPIDYVAGTSIGAFIGSLYAFGMDWEEMASIAVELKWLDITGLSLSKFGVMSNKRLGDLLDKYIGEVTFEESNLPLAVVATDIATGEKVVLKQGKVAHAVMASTSIPGIFNPVEINGRLLVDGGIVENVPISPLKEFGADRIIGVDLNAKYANERPGNIVEVLMNSFHFTLMTAAKLQTEEADVLLTPDLSSFSKININKADALIETGYQEACRKLKDLQSDR